MDLAWLKFAVAALRLLMICHCLQTLDILRGTLPLLLCPYPVSADIFWSDDIFLFIYFAIAVMVSYQHRCHLITESKKRVESVFSLLSLHQRQFKFWISGWATKIKYNFDAAYLVSYSPTKIINSDTKDYKIGTLKVIFKYHISIDFFLLKILVYLGAALLIFW